MQSIGYTLFFPSEGKEACNQTTRYVFAILGDGQALVGMCFQQAGGMREVRPVMSKAGEDY